jgi:membrane fusion protein (multidrug efflux system)
MKTRLVWGAIAVATVLLIILPKVFATKKNEPIAAQFQPLSVNGVAVKPRTLENKIYTSGTLISNEEVDLRSEITGKVSKIFFQEGTSVEKGALLLKINDDELQAQKKRALHQKKLAEVREERQRQLLAEKAASQEEYDIALNELNTLKAQIEVLNAQIDRTEIRAPFRGKIGLRYVSEGSYIAPATRIATLQNTTPMKLDFAVPEKYAAQIRTGDKVFFRVQSSPELFEARLYAVEPKIDLATRTVQLRAIYPNKNGEVFAGAFADVELVLSELQNAIMIPSESLVPELKGQKVFLYRNGKAAESKVEIGLRTEKEVQITKGVQSGDTILTTGILQARDGMDVSITVQTSDRRPR